MGKAFTKGQRVTVIGDWDRKGTVWVRHATVHSCGTKVLRLTCEENGDEFGHELFPVEAMPGRVGVRPYIAGLAMEVEAMAVAVHQLEEERKHLTECRDRNANSTTPCRHYIGAMNKSLAALHEPRFGMYADLCENVRLKVAAG